MLTEGRLRAFLLLLAMMLNAGTAMAAAKQLDIHPARLLLLNDDHHQSHHGILQGIPKHFDWAKKPRIEPITKVFDYGAIIGWGHVLWNGELPPSNYLVQIRNFQFFACIGKDRRWVRLQKGDITGAQFNTKFKNNASKKSSIQETENGVTTVRFDYGQVFHYWSKQGRSKLGHETVHGILTLMESRMVDENRQAIKGNPPSHFIIGGGADLWKQMNSKWDNFKSHTDLGVGRMKYVGPNWTWYGYSNALSSDLKRLSKDGFYDRSK